jgi:putative membrane protein
LLSLTQYTIGNTPFPFPITNLLLIYTITWLLQSIGQLLFWGMPGPALVGFVVMGLFVAGAWRNFGNWQR